MISDPCMESFTCEKDKSQVGHDIAYQSAETRADCASACCRNTECIGFDWLESKHCFLSKTPRSQVPLTEAEDVWSCEKKTVADKGTIDICVTR